MSSEDSLSWTSEIQKELPRGYKVTPRAEWRLPSDEELVQEMHAARKELGLNKDLFSIPPVLRIPHELRTGIFGHGFSIASERGRDPGVCHDFFENGKFWSEIMTATLEGCYH